jgi:hypothetical protein
LVATEYRSHFESTPGVDPKSGSRDGWESFPLSQEAGYDPTLQVETLEGKGAIVREAAPTQDGPLRLGFIRRVHLLARSRASFHARIRAPYLTGKATVRVSVFRGALEEHHDLIITGPDWQNVDCSLTASDAWLTAVTADVNFEHAHTDRAERVLMTDVRVQALAPERMLLVEPQALWDATRELFYVQRSVLLGEALAARVAMSEIEQPHWSLLSPDGRQHIGGKGVEAKYHFTSNDPIGIWTLRFESDHASTTVLVLVKSKKTGLLFDQVPKISAEMLASIRDRQQELQRVVHPETGLNISRMDPNWLLPGLPSYFAIALQPAELAMLDAITFRATGDAKALDQAIEILRSITSWPRWVHPWFPAHGYHSYYAVGIMAKYITISEEFLGKDLPEMDRRGIERALMDRAVEPIYEEYVLEDRLQFNTSNWIGNTVGGALLAALANNDRSAAGYALGLFVKDRDHLRAAYTRDGSYGEGVTYQRFDLEMTTLVAQAAKRELGTSVDELLVNADRYMLHAAYGTSGLMDFGDSHVDLKPSNVFAYLASEDQSPSLTEFYFRYRDTGTSQLLSRVLWESKIKPVEEKPIEDEPASALFPERGVAVLRNSWQPLSSVAAMRAGLNFNHNHADQGSLFYASGGLLWFGEAGYADYYKDPSYVTFYIQAVGHNTLLVDGNPESQNLPGNAVEGVAPQITHALVGDDGSLVQADLTSVYGGTLSSYTRSLFFDSGGRLIVVDSIAAKSAHTFQQMWHPKQDIAEFDAADSRLQLASETARVGMQAFGTQPLVSAKVLDPMPLESYQNAEHGLVQRPIRIEVSTKQAATATTLVTLIEPESTAVTGGSLANWNDDGQFAVLKVGDSVLRIRHAKSAKGPEIVAWSKNSILMFSGTRCEDERRGESVSTNHVVDMAMRRTTTGSVMLEINASQTTEVKLIGLAVVGKDGGATQGISSLTVNAGHTVLILHPKMIDSNR